MVLDATRKRKNKTMSDKLINELMDAYQNKGSAIKKKKTHTKWQSQIKLLHITGGNKWQELII